MRHLRSLVIFVLVWPQLSLGLTQQFYTHYQLQSALNMPVTTTLTGSNEVKRTEQSYEYRLQGLGDLVSIASGVTIAQPDYSSYIVKTQDMVDVPLSQMAKHPTEYKGTALVTLAKGDHTGSVRWTGSLSETPLPMQRVDLSFEEGFFNKTTLIGVEYTYLRQEQPLSFFQDRDFRRQKRAEVVDTTALGAYYEQILSRRWKNMVKATTAHRMNERPRNYGIEDRVGFALARRFYLQGAAGYIFEDPKEALHDERGYFNSTRGELVATYEPVYDLLISVSYGLLVEQEYEPHTDVKTQVGSDQYGLGVQYSYGDWQFNVKGNYYVAQVGRGGSALGGITWTF